MKLLIIDYGSGNLHSVYNSIKFLLSNENLKIEIVVSNKNKIIKNADFIILPGVGSFKSCKDNLLKFDGMVENLLEYVFEKKKLFLGICVGMQLMSDFGHENGIHSGLGWISGEVISLDQKNELDMKIPHMGWNNLINKNDNKLFKNIDENDQFYFVHSYFFKTNSNKDVLSYTHYGKIFPSIISKDNIFGFQFHPEKSSYAGQKILLNWLTYN